MEIPSIPKFKWYKFKCVKSETNWNWVLLESNWYHINKEIKNVIKDVVKAICLIWLLSSCIGKRSIEPKIGSRISKVIIYYY